MKSRVTAIVTLFLLILIAFLLIQSCNLLADNVDEALRTELTVACESLGMALEDVPNAQRNNKLTEILSGDRDVDGALYDMSGKASFSSEGTMFSLSSDDRGIATVGEVREYSKKNVQGDEAIYAIYQFEDGTFLLLTRNKQTGFGILRSNGAIIAIFGAMFVLLCNGAYVSITAARKEKLTKEVMQSLDHFSEGRFENRVELLTGKGNDVAVINAILERLQERVLKQTRNNNALRMVVNQMQSGIIAVDEQMRVVLVSGVAKKLLGIIGNPDGKPVTEVSANARLDEAFTEGMGQESVYITEVAARALTGRGHKPLRLYISTMRNEGKIVGALAMVEDITEVKHMEQIRTDFAANVSHELKTPLTSIRGFVETLENGAIDNPQMAHKFLRIIMLETERLTRLINDILSISKLESGENEVSVSRLRLDKMAYDVSDMLSLHAGEKEVSITCHQNDEPVYIIGNNDRVEQLLINLIENAIKYNKPGGSVTVQVFARGKEAIFSVSDTGIGIAEENLPRVFERFYRVDKGRSRQMGGTGLGLAIVKHIVKTMGGEIEVHSKLGEGTEFLVTLPLAPAEDKPAEE